MGNMAAADAQIDKFHTHIHKKANEEDVVETDGNVQVRVRSRVKSDPEDERRILADFDSPNHRVSSSPIGRALETREADSAFGGVGDTEMGNIVSDEDTRANESLPNSD